MSILYKTFFNRCQVIKKIFFYLDNSVFLYYFAIMTLISPLNIMSKKDAKRIDKLRVVRPRRRYTSVTVFIMSRMYPIMDRLRISEAEFKRKMRQGFNASKSEIKPHCEAQNVVEYILTELELLNDSAIIDDPDNLLSKPHQLTDMLKKGIANDTVN